MHKNKLIGAILLLGVCTMFTAQALPSIDGSYTCSVTDKTLTPKTHVTGGFILKKSGNVYLLDQLDASGKNMLKNAYHIFGLRSGNVLALAYQNVTDADVFGLETMTISDDGKILHGTFVYWKKFDKKNVETCVR